MSEKDRIEKLKKQLEELNELKHDTEAKHESSSKMPEVSDEIIEQKANTEVLDFTTNDAKKSEEKTKQPSKSFLKFHVIMLMLLVFFVGFFLSYYWFFYY